MDLHQPQGAEALVGRRPAALAVEDLAWAPGPGEPIISGLGFAVAPGEMLALVGPNGAGKSSLLRCLYRYHRPREGRVLLDGVDIWSLPARDCARRMATVLQEPASDFGLSVAEIVELGLTPHLGWTTRAHDLDPVERALELMGVSGLAARSFASLSGGEKQRVLIARALAQGPDILILDEPTNHLDIRHQLEVLAMLARLPITVIVSLHDLSLATAHADRVLVLEKGRMVELGTPLDALTPERIRQTFAVETAIDTHPATGRPRFSFHLHP
ncbi:ABC transporter ATP-binding protein [Arsenicitalea aurantiaca]|uniref:ABC transporter ATP-binding protein n=1 Tax=Arsenicitalea aurantiaca TaxID=1783274 RepID=A0A433X5S0_9HYPH|nr:ABC transporter ATP-binding protein [Arsenicitalea aurantiaca]RUT29391.1 ABC transporter ATP-binding protein [Arsenicitalea aurantiaca]